MTKKPTFTKAELLRLASIAKEQGVAISLERDGTKIAIAPCPVAPALEPPRDEVAGPVLDHPAPPIDSGFDHRERAAMEQLVAAGVGIPVRVDTMHCVGPFTCQRLAGRGYVEILVNETGRSSGERVALTGKGLQDWKALGGYYERYPAL
ncbi:hypothetical protein HHL25_03000 [Rhizobium sp. S-51]|uniref:Uncharacterized protein n=1 Tax=Rhizobium terricola TaxID=2728849 RepID=A0A7Y0AT89_9HYPH|nr:hypothetical protein [Rhizobium terricola]NML73087.1 hypothetical protein [Rhizobium terricola]